MTWVDWIVGTKEKIFSFVSGYYKTEDRYMGEWSHNLKLSTWIWETFIILFKKIKGITEPQFFF